MGKGLNFNKFKALCDQLSAIGQPVDESDKLHWFLCGLGASFVTFLQPLEPLNRSHPSVIFFLKQKVTNFF